jgi:Hedgehog signalling target
VIYAVDTIGQHGVQLFVDAGRPVDDTLVTALIREVLAEKINSMLGERELERLARRRHESQHPVAAAAADGRLQQSPVCIFITSCLLALCTMHCR